MGLLRGDLGAHGLTAIQYSHTAASGVIIDVYKNIDGRVWLAEKVAPRSDD